MSAETDTNHDWSDTEGISPSSNETTSSPAGRDAPLGEHPAVEIEPAPSAHCCGARGCHETERLQEVSIDSYGTRVVCPSHAEHLIKRETR